MLTKKFPAGSNALPISICLLIIIITLCIYAQVRHFDFVGFDDNEYVYENIHVKTGLSSKNIGWALTAFYSNNWHPLTWISHMLDCQLFGLHPGAHHLINLFFHIINSLLLFFIFSKMTGDLWKSGFIAMVFAVHPLHVESVVWIAERKDVLSAFFWLLTMGCYYHYAKRPGPLTYAMVLLFFILGLLSKPMIITLPFVLLLLDYWPLQRFQNHIETDGNIGKKWVYLVLEKIPFFLLVPVSGLLTFYAQHHGGVVKSLEAFPLNVRIANAIVSYAAYIGKMIYPVKMAFLYPHHGMPSLWNILVALVLLAAMSIASMKYYKKYPYLIVGWLWYLGTLVPVIGIVQVGMQSMADRYTYIPSIGLTIMMAWGVPDIMTQWRHKKIWLGATTATAMAIFAVISWKQAGYWKNTRSMLEHTIQVTSNNYIALDNMAVEFLRKGQIDQAVDYHLRSQKIYPHNPYSHFSLGVAYFMQGKNQEAIQQYQEAIKLAPEYYQAYTNLGAAHFTIGNMQEAIANYLKAIKINPAYIDAYVNLGLAYDKSGQFDDAIVYYQKALHLDPANSNAHFMLAGVLEKIGNIDEAIKHYGEIVKLKPSRVDVQYRLGVALYKQGRISEAIQCYLEVLKKNPENPETLNSLGSALYMQGRVDEAIEKYMHAVRIKPDYAEAHNNLGAAYFQKGEVHSAVSCFQTALRIHPDYTSAKNNLLQALAKLQRHH